MSELLLAALERLSPRLRRIVVAVGALLTLAAVMAALIASHGERQGLPARQHHALTSPPRTPRHRPAPPVSATALVQAHRVAERFLAGYLPFAYGRGSALAIAGITSAMRRQLLRRRAELTPVERSRRPRVVLLQTTATMPTFVVATAVIDDGGVTNYRLRFELEGRAGRWLVSGVQEG